MSEITEEFTRSREKRGKNSTFSFLQVLFLMVAVLTAAVFVGGMLFGENSLEVYWSLQKQQQILDRKISRLSLENARLQKKYFELKSLMPEPQTTQENRKERE